jgi:uncharacterized protein
MSQENKNDSSDANDYVIRVFDSVAELHAETWDDLLLAQGRASPLVDQPCQSENDDKLALATAAAVADATESPAPFMRHAYLLAMEQSASAHAETGWQPQFVTLWQGTQLCAACPLYLKPHSYGEYVFDWAWAKAYAEHGLAYYPRAVSAVPFTPVPGARLLAVSDAARAALVQAVLAWCEQTQISSWHVLFAAPQDIAAAQAQGMMLRHSVQFHWHNQALPQAYADMGDFLQSLNQDKRKKIKQERRKVAQAGVSFRWARGADISAADWAFFYSCYERTYLEHGNAPYLTPAFFEQMATTTATATSPNAQGMAAHWLLFVAEREGRPIACSLIGLDSANAHPRVAYGRYWGALERVDCLHFEACYYQPIEWCIAHGVQRFEGGAQGEHKMARALLPTTTTSAHWLAHPGFAQAVQRFLDREGQGIQNYMDDLQSRTPLKAT